jgi:hypothetical protein
VKYDSYWKLDRPLSNWSHLLWWKFYTCPSVFHRIYTIHIQIDGIMYPVVYALLPSKSEQVYKRFFNLVQRTTRSRRFRILARKIEFGVFRLFRMRKKIYSWKNRGFWWISIFFPHIIRKSVRNCPNTPNELGKKFGIVRMSLEKNSELSEYSEWARKKIRNFPNTANWPRKKIWICPNTPNRPRKKIRNSELRSETTTLFRKILSDSEIIPS